MYRIALVALLALPSLAFAQPQPQPKTHSVKLNGHTFTLPEGFTIEVAADAKLAPRPIAAAFDEKGRLYVTDSSGSNAKVAEQVKEKPHRIVRLESTKGDGVFDKQTVFVKNVMFPEGCMWLNGSLYVAAPPHIWKFTDTDDDGVADKEEVWFDGKTLTGCANDLHGPYRGPDGYIYWTKGAFAEQDFTLPGGKQIKSRAAHIYRAKPDGSQREVVMTGGMDNPVDVVFTPGGDIIFSTTFFQHPRDGKRDGLIHAVYGGVYGKDHSPVYDHPWTSPELMPPMTHMGPAAPCGLHRYESDQFGPDYANNIFCCQFNMRKVSRHVLVPKGSTYETKDSDFVVSDSLDFHPTDVIEDADGSLLIVDTGGWYKLCCPTSQLVKPDVTGAIYRVRKAGAHNVYDPRGLQIDWKKANTEKLEELLRDSRPAVWQRATDVLVTRPKGKNIPESGNAAFVRAGIPNSPEDLRLRALWGLSRLPDPDLTFIRRRLSGSKEDSVRVAAAHFLGLHRHRAALPELCEGVTKGTLPVRRACAAALGRIGDPAAVPSILLALTEATNDRALDHALAYALIEIGDAKATAKLLTEPSIAVRRAALAALENIPNSGLEAKAVFAYLGSQEPELRETAWWIAGRHPQWGEGLVPYFRERLKEADKLTAAERDELAARLTKFTGNPAVQNYLGDQVAYLKPEAMRVAFAAMARSGLKALPDSWRGGLLGAAPALETRDVLRAALDVIRVLPLGAKDYDDFAGKLPRAKLWPNGVAPMESRLALMAARPPGLALDPATFGFLRDRLHREEAAGDRAAAADVLLRAKLSLEQLTALAEVFKTASPLDLPKVLSLYAKTTDKDVGRALVKALRDKEVRAMLRAEMVKPILDKYPRPVLAEAEKLYAELAEARKGETEKLEKMLAGMKPGDVRRGQLVFNSKKAQCIACHKVGYVGGTAGPDLTRIGGIRTERDLLESILFPSASFVRSYEPVRVVTKDERVLNGVLKKDAPDEVVVITAADKEERVARGDIESIAPSTVSLMPAGLEQQLSQQDIADLIAFLKASK